MDKNQVKIEKIGSFYDEDDNGYLINQSSLLKFSSPWKEVVEESKLIYLELFGDLVDSIYVRGTVSRGLATEYVSDVDTIAVMKVSQEEIVLLLKQTEIHIKRLEKKYRFAQKVEFNIYSRDEILSEGSSTHEKFVLKVQSVCIYGENVSDWIQPFRWNKVTIQKIHPPINESVERIYRNCQYDKDFITTKKLCCWIMKKFIRLGLDLSIEYSNKYATDLYPCYSLFCEAYPEKKEMMTEIFQYYLNPVSTTSELKELLDKYNKWFLGQYNLIFKP